jgi:hypothetical protein
MPQTTAMKKAKKGKTHQTELGKSNRSLDNGGIKQSSYHQDKQFQLHPSLSSQAQHTLMWKKVWKVKLTQFQTRVQLRLLHRIQRVIT